MIRSKRCVPSWQTIALFAAVAGLWPGAPLHAQYGNPWNYDYGGGGRSIVDSIAARIHGEADFVRAIGEASVDFARARKIRAEAYDKELDNVLKYAETYWKRRDLYEAEKLERYISPEVRRRLLATKTWQRLKHHPELSEAAISNGTALNFLLDRLSGTILAYHYSSTAVDQKLVEKLQLDPGTLHTLRLQQRLSGGRQLVFRADEGVTLDVDWWPFSLRDDDLAKQREAFVTARQTVAEPVDGRIGTGALKDLMRALDELDAAFRKQNTKQKRLRSMEDFRHFLTAERFLQSLAGEIHQIQETGDPRAFDGSLKFERGDLMELLSHMSRNGLHFAPATPGNESAYHAVFRMMRDLYVTVADEYVGEPERPQD